MPDQYGNLTEAELRGQFIPPALTGYVPPSRADLRARDANARAGLGTFDNGHVSLTGPEFRSSTDAAVVAERNRMLMGGRSDPDLLFGPTAGRQQSPEERRYREQYRAFMNNPNDGVSGSEAARAVGLWALAPIAGYALGPAGAGAGAAGAAAPAAAPVAGGGGGLLAGGTGVAGGAGAAAGALPEIVVTGGLGGGITASQAVLGGAGAAAAGSLNTGGMSSGLQNNSGLGLFSNGGQGGMAEVGGGNAGVVANRGVIPGGAGVGSATTPTAPTTMDWIKAAGSLAGNAPQGQQMNIGDTVNSQVGRAPTQPTMSQKFSAGLGRVGEALLPVDPRVAAASDPAFLQAMRGQALMKMGLGMMSAASQGGRFGESFAAGVGLGQAGFDRDIESTYQRGVEDREQKRRDDLLKTSDTRYAEEQAYQRERDKLGDERNQRDFDATQQYRKDSLASMERRAQIRAKPAGASLSDAAIDFAAKRLLNGEPANKVLANFGRGAQGAQNITAVQNRLADLAAEGGVSPQLMAVLTQELAADSRTRLELGAREGKVAARVEEAKQFANIAGQASLKVPRGEWVAVSRLLQFTDTQLSSPELAAFKAANTSLINAYAAAVGGGVPTVHDKEAAEKMLNTAQSPEAYQAVVNQLITEMDAALAAPRNVMQEMREHDLGAGGLGHPGAAPQPQPAPWMPPAATPPANNGWSIRPRGP